MAEHGWGHDPDFVEDSQTTNSKLFWLSLFASTGGAAFAVNHWMFGSPGFHWPGCFVSSVCGAAAFLLFSRKEGLPISAAIGPGFVAGAGAYSACVWYLSIRDSIRVFELIIPSVVGTAPGLIIYIIAVRIYHTFFDEQPDTT